MSLLFLVRMFDPDKQYVNKRSIDRRWKDCV